MASICYYRDTSFRLCIKINGNRAEDRQPRIKTAKLSAELGDGTGAGRPGGTGPTAV